MDIPNGEVRVKTEEIAEEYMLPSVKIVKVDGDFATETKIEFEYSKYYIKTEQEPERLMEPSPKFLAELQQNAVNPEADCSLWNEQTDVKYSGDDPEEDNFRYDSSSVGNDQESIIDCDESENAYETLTVISNSNSSNEDAPPEFEKVFVYDMHLDKDEQITSNEHLSVYQEPPTRCSSWSDEVDHPRGTGLDSTIVNSKGGSHQLKDCSGEGSVQVNKTIVRTFILQTSKNLKTKKRMEVETLICSFCDYKCSYGFQLNRHLRTHSRDKPLKPFQCEICSKRFSSKLNFSRHLRIHTEEKPFECKICNERFSQNSRLSSHMIIHTCSVKKPFQCTVCNKKFSKKLNLSTHFMTHTGEKSFECTVCNRRFSRKSNLSTHMKTHTEKSFQCAICNKMFSLKHELSKHLRTHTGEKSFECTIFNEMFSHNSSLSSHMKTHNH